MEKVEEILATNAENEFNTLVTFYYAGYGAQVSNQQVLIVNGSQVEPSGDAKWRYVFEIEKWFKERLSKFANTCYLWAVYNYCESNSEPRDDFYEESKTEN